MLPVLPVSQFETWHLEGKLSTFREKTGRANGLFFDKAGNLIACEGGNGQLTSITPEGKVTVLACRYAGKSFNSPNDLWIDPKGGIYFTDPRYGRSTGPLPQDGFHVYYLPPGGGKVVRVVDDLVKPNGIVGTADGQWLYVADPGAGKTYRYRLQPDGALADKELYVESGSDGMTLDAKGNLYLTTDAVVVFDPQGKQIARIEVPERPANVCFGGADRKTLFITARTSLYTVPMTVPGQ